MTQLSARNSEMATLNGMSYHVRNRGHMDKAFAFIVEKEGWEMGFLCEGISREMSSSSPRDYGDALRTILREIEKEMASPDSKSPKSGRPGRFRLYDSAHAIFLELISIAEEKRERADGEMRRLELLANEGSQPIPGSNAVQVAKSPVGRPGNQ